MSRRALVRIRTSLTILILAVILLAGVSWAWAAVTKPFPAGDEDDATPSAPCVDTPVQQGDRVRPQDVTVSVINAGRREGLAEQTRRLLTQAGFGAGDLDNAPDDAQVFRAQIWAADAEDPAVLLIRTYLGPRTPIVDRDTADQAGITVVVGDGFKALQQGRAMIVAARDATVCLPTSDK